MSAEYNFKEIEKRSQELWDRERVFRFTPQSKKETFSMFMTPPNASGQLHIGNSLMIALQDILARYHRAKGKSVLWVPGLDHGGYETQVTYEREQDKHGVHKTREEVPSKELYNKIESFVEKNKSDILQQIKSLGASMDLHRSLYTMDPSSIALTNQTFNKMVQDGVIVRNRYMMNYCPDCSTVLTEIEIKKSISKGIRYGVQFARNDTQEHVIIETTQPEYIYSMTHVLVHPKDERFSHLIGVELVNPITNKPIHVIKSERSILWHQEHEYLPAFFPSFERFDYEYAIRHDLPATNQLNWNGTLIHEYPGKTILEVRALAIASLKENSCIVSEYDIDTEKRTCKKGHTTTSLIKLAWFLDIDNTLVPLRKNAIDAFEREDPIIYTNWHKRGILDWLKKMQHWPISRQNVWGIRLPVWYEITDTSDFLVWFFDHNQQRQHGRLQDFLTAGYSLEEIQAGLQRVYAEEKCTWTTTPETGKQYLAETDTFDTWFSSSLWGVHVYQEMVPDNFEDYFPSSNIVLGHDLLRLSISRKILLTVYLTNRLPSKRVFFHPLINGEDGQKMSKSLGNSVTLNEYLETHGADATRCALISKMSSANDFSFSSQDICKATEFLVVIRQLGQAYNIIIDFGITDSDIARLESSDFAVVKLFDTMSRSVAKSVETYFFEKAQTEAMTFHRELLRLGNKVMETGSRSSAVAFLQLFRKYLIILHPFAPHLTEDIFQGLRTTPSGTILATEAWPK